jgi:hypothetical protein
MPVPNVCIFTIASRNYMHSVRTLMEGVTRFSPDGTHRLLALCDKRGNFDFSQDTFEIIDLDQIPLPDKQNFIFQYSLLEINTAIKPFVFELLFKRGFEKVIYFDPDIAIYSSLEDMIHRLDDSNILLTPHLTAPIDDGRFPSERDILISGSKNLGFAAFRKTNQTCEFIKWWQSKLERDCVVDYKRGLFVDQKWMEFTTDFCDRVQIVRHPGWNVAYWNLSTRVIESKKPLTDSNLEDSAFTSNGEPLVFFHFSGLNVEKNFFSRHQNRFTLTSLPPAVEALVKSYHSGLVRNGIIEIQKTPYHYANFPDGTPIPDLARKIFRENRVELVKQFPDPARKDSTAFIRYINEPYLQNGRSSPFITRIAREAQRSHPYLPLEEQFPDILGAQARSFTEWLIGPGREYYKLDEIFIDPIKRAYNADGGNADFIRPRKQLIRWIYLVALKLKDTTIARWIPLKFRKFIATLLFRRSYVD